MNLEIDDFFNCIEEGQKWQVQKRGLWTDTEKEKETQQFLKENRLTKEKMELINNNLKKK